MSKVCVCSSYFIVNDVGELCLQPGTMGPRQILTYTVAGTYQFKKADYPWLARIMVEAQGGGGGSAGAAATSSQCIPRSGGAGGAYAMSLLDVTVLGDVETVVVGSGGSAGSGNNPGGAGDGSSFGGFVTAPGGNPGTDSLTSGTTTATSGGILGPASGTGQIFTSGGTSDGSLRLSGTSGLSGTGGNSHFGYGGTSRATEGPGTSPRGYGAGAGGALSYGGSVNGAAGGDGLVVITLYG